MKFDFDDINLIPKKCIVDSRSECDTSLSFGNFKLKMPIIPANMECVINEDLAVNLVSEGYFYIMHRFGDTLSFIKNMHEKCHLISISIGVNQDSYELIDKIIQNDYIIDYITIDIAHGHAVKMQKMIAYIKLKLPYTFIIAGNVSSPEAVIDLAKWGANAVKVGIGPGSACSTYPSTGFGSRNCQASTIEECTKALNIPIIADGGIKTPADITKSLVMGATMCMVGGMLSGFNDSPGDVINIDGRIKKEFWGSASQHQSNKTNRIEGIKNLIDYKDKSIIDEMNYLHECLQSSISYAGGKDLNSLKKVKYKI